MGTGDLLPTRTPKRAFVYKVNSEKFEKKRRVRGTAMRLLAALTPILLLLAVCPLLLTPGCTKFIGRRPAPLVGGTKPAETFAVAPKLRYASPKAAHMKSAGLDSVRRLMQRAVRDSVFPGAVLLIARNGKIVLHQAFGLFGYGPFARPMPVNAIFDLASVTKVVATTTACMLLYERGVLALDTPVQEYLPAFTGANKQKVTIRHLLTHCSGLIAYRRYFLDHHSAEAILRTILKEELVYPTGTKMIYSDLGVILLGKIVEKVSGRSLDEFCRDEIFEPLGMSSTFYNPPPTLVVRIPPTERDTLTPGRRGNVVHGVVHDENAFVLGGVAGHAGLFSTARDLAVFLQMLLNGGSYGNVRLLSPDTIALFTKRQDLVPASSRALGWDTANGRNSAGTLMSPRAFGHTGFTGTSVWVDPDTGLIVVLLTNRVHPTRKNRRILRFRPLLHDAVVRALASQ